MSFSTRPQALPCAGTWRSRSRETQPRVVLAATLVFALAGCGGGGSAPQKPPRVHAPPITPDIVATRGERQFEYYERQVLLIDRWIARSGIAPGMAAGLIDAMRQSRDQSGKQTSLGAGDLVTDLEGWLSAAQGLDPERRAAAYLVADRVLRLAWRPFQLSLPDQQQDARDTLKALGAESFASGATKTVAYSGTWLTQAAQLDPTGPMGQRAVLLTLETDCAGGDSPDSYHRILGRLDSVGGSAADSEVKFTADVLEADAYRDIAALASGFGRANADSAKFSPEAPAARAKALTLYEAALAMDSTSRLARGARIAHDRLASGQPLDHTRFFCFEE